MGENVETKELIMMMGGGLASLIMGGITKKIPQVSNALIPLINGAVLTFLFATIGGLGFTYLALTTGMAAAYVGTAAYELKNVAKPGGGS